MPLFDCKCLKCGALEERLVMMSDIDEMLEPCQDCGGNMTKLVAAPNIMFKSGGWAGEEIRSENRFRKKVEDIVSSNNKDD